MIPWLVLNVILNVFDVFGVLGAINELIHIIPSEFLFLPIAGVALQIYCLMAVYSLFQNIKEKSESGFRNKNIIGTAVLVTISNEVSQEKDSTDVNIV